MTERADPDPEADTDTRIDGSDRLAAAVAAAFDLGPARTWRDLGGSWTTNLLLEVAAGPVVARVHQASTGRDHLEAQQQVRRLLAGTGIPTLPPRSGPDGGTIAVVAGRLVETEAFVAADVSMNTPELLLAGFPTLARIHDVLRSAPLPDAARTVRYANALPAEEADAATRTGAERIRSWADPALTAYAGQVVGHIEAVTDAEQPLWADQARQVVHGDFWDNNVLFTHGGELAAVLDFGFMAERMRLDDLALPFWFWLLQPGRELPTDDDVALLVALADAYDSATTTPLRPAERVALPLAVARQPAWSIGRWVLELDEPGAVGHARAAAAELPVAQAVLADLRRWQDALAG